jgi:hypothetical protein
VDQEVGVGSGGTVIEGIRLACWDGRVSKGGAAEQLASKKNKIKLRTRNRFSLIVN